MKTAAILLSLALLAGCECERQSHYRASGYVRNVWLEGTYNVTFEHDTGSIAVIRFCNQPGVWAGEHFILAYYKDPSYGCVWFGSAKRDRK